MITGLYSASADSIPILCITGQAPVARLHKEDFQAVDIAAIAAPLTKMAMTVLEPAQVPGRVPAGVPPDAVRPARPGADRPADRRADGRDRVRPRDLPAAAGRTSRRPPARRPSKALDMLAAAERPLIVAGGGIINADAADLLVELAELTGRAGDPDPDGLGHHPGRPPADGRHGRPADLAPLRQRDDAGLRLRARHRQPVGQPAHRRRSTPTARAGRSCTSTSSRPRSAGSSPPTTGSSPTPRPRWSSSSRWPGSARRPASLPDRSGSGPRSARSASAPCSGAPTSTTSRSSRSGCTRR